MHLNTLVSQIKVLDKNYSIADKNTNGNKVIKNLLITF